MQSGSDNSRYAADDRRYDDDDLYQRCGRSGLRLPRLALGLWHNFGGKEPSDEARRMLLNAFDAGITHFDLANNYG
ncbi:MAG: L-glyceraldehyde 3-phosphate reductase, partial [Acidimicrobiales bacterium]|nr:L-glyceraldehyde 3-phosphate reductase [Acidimicrobiales bacterium]